MEKGLQGKNEGARLLSRSPERLGRRTRCRNERPHTMLARCCRSGPRATAAPSLFPTFLLPFCLSQPDLELRDSNYGHLWRLILLPHRPRHLSGSTSSPGRPLLPPLPQSLASRPTVLVSWPGAPASDEGWERVGSGISPATPPELSHP